MQAGVASLPTSSQEDDAYAGTQVPLAPLPERGDTRLPQRSQILTTRSLMRSVRFQVVGVREKDVAPHPPGGGGGDTTHPGQPLSQATKNMREWTSAQTSSSKPVARWPSMMREKMDLQTSQPRYVRRLLCSRSRIDCHTATTAGPAVHPSAPNHVGGGHLDSKCGKVALHARRDDERADGGVEACHKLRVPNFLEKDLLLVIPARKRGTRRGWSFGRSQHRQCAAGSVCIIAPTLPQARRSPATVVNALAQKLNSRLRVVIVHAWHVAENGQGEGREHGLVARQGRRGIVAGKRVDHKAETHRSSTK